MKLFQRFLAPKWKNKNPDIRKQALIALNRDDNQSIFLDIANHDNVSDIRQLATKRLNNLDELLNISTNNSDTYVRDLAHKLISQILANSTDICEKDRIEKITALDEQSPQKQKTLEFIALKGDTSPVRTAAINKINREALLGDLAIKDPDQQIRISTAQRLNHKSTLERVLKATKNKDKQISKIIKTKLEEITAEAQRPKLLLAQQKSICLSMEQLGNKGLWERDKTQFDQLNEQWQKLDKEMELVHQSRFDTASTAFQDKFAGYLTRNEARLKEEAALLPIKQEKQTALEQLNKLVDAINNNEDVSSQLHQAEQQWRSIQSLPDELEQGFQTQFQNIARDIKAKLHNIARTTKDNKALDTLHADITQKLNNSHQLIEKHISAFEKKLLSVKIDSEDLVKISARITDLIAKAKNIIEKNDLKTKKLLLSTKDVLSLFEKALVKGEIKSANDAQKKIQANIKQLDKLAQAHQKNQLSEYKIQLSELSSQLFELNKWRSWANTPQKERLVVEIEALIDSDIAPKEIAFLVSKARKDWKKLGPSEQSSSKALWTRFNTACDAAYEPCKTVFNEESKIRAGNCNKRVSFLNDLESFINNANWENINWTKVENLYQQSRTAWQNLGPVDKNKRKALNNRFNTAYTTLKSQLTVEWERNEKLKQAVVDEAKASIEKENVNEAINSAKALQQQWKKIGRVQHFTEKALWAEFRGHCDAIFERRNSAKKQKIADDKEIVSAKSTLCEKLETLCEVPSKNINDNRELIFSLRKQIRDLPPGDTKQDKKVKDRVDQALLVFELKQTASKRIGQIKSLTILKSKIEFVQHLENNIENNVSINWESIATQYADLASAPDPAWDNIINGRFNTLRDASSSDELSKELRKKLGEIAKNNLPTILTSTIQLEIISEVDSPSDEAAERLKIQTQRLSDKMNRHSTEQDTEESQWDAFINSEANWLLTGPLPASQLETFKSRHAAIINELKQYYSEELENY